MGIHIFDAALLHEVTRDIKNKETVICLGEPELDFTYIELCNFASKVGITIRQDASVSNSFDAKELFGLFGFSNYVVLDISDYQGAEIVHNLNQVFEDEKYLNSADLIFDGGTLEHVYNVPVALNTINRLLKIGGCIVHSSPCNGYVDHGFYQFSPTLFYDLYRANAYEILLANLTNHSKGVHSEAYLGDVYRSKGKFYGCKKLPRALLLFCAKKTMMANELVAPTQSYYVEMHEQSLQDYQVKYKYDFKFTDYLVWLKFIVPQGLKRLIKGK